MRPALTFVETIPLAILVTLPLVINWTKFTTVFLTNSGHYSIQITGRNQAHNSFWLGFVPVLLQIGQRGWQLENIPLR